MTRRRCVCPLPGSKESTRFTHCRWCCTEEKPWTANFSSDTAFDQHLVNGNHMNPENRGLVLVEHPETQNTPAWSGWHCAPEKDQSWTSAFQED